MPVKLVRDVFIENDRHWEKMVQNYLPKGIGKILIKFEPLTIMVIQGGNVIASDAFRVLKTFQVFWHMFPNRDHMPKDTDTDNASWRHCLMSLLMVRPIEGMISFLIEVVLGIATFIQENIERGTVPSFSGAEAREGCLETGKWNFGPFS